MITKKIYVLLFATAIGIISCQKSKLNKETTTDEDNSTAENLMAQIEDDADDASEQLEDESFKTSKTDRRGLIDTCAEITVGFSSDSSYIDSITIDYGSTGCVSSNTGRTRRGIIRITQTGRHREVGTIRTITTENFYVNDYKVEATRIVTTEYADAATNTYRFNVSVEGKITDPDGNTFTWSSNRTRETIIANTGITVRLLAGGTTVGTNRNGKKYTATIIETLEKRVLCKWISKGIIEVTPEDLAKRTINYGDGTCDSKAEVSVKNKTKEISLR